MIHFKPPPCRLFFYFMWHTKRKVPHSICIFHKCLLIPLLLSRVCPLTPAEIAGLFLLTVNHEMWNETGSNRKNTGIKILDEEPVVLPAQAVHLLSLGRLELPAHHATWTQAATPGTATQWRSITACMFSQLVFLVWQHEGLPHNLISHIYIYLIFWLL